jgi:hypothetical protein
MAWNLEAWDTEVIVLTGRDRRILLFQRSWGGVGSSAYMIESC